jgi:hypothetical protein
MVAASAMHPATACLGTQRREARRILLAPARVALHASFEKTLVAPPSAHEARVFSWTRQDGSGVDGGPRGAW